MWNRCCRYTTRWPDLCRSECLLSASVGVHPDDRGDADGCVEIVTVTGARPQFIKTSIMKIGILTQYYEPEIGAPQARLSALANALVERGHEVYVLTGMPSYPTGRVYSGYGGAFRRETLKGVRVFRSYIYATKSVGMAKRLANYFYICAFVGSCRLCLFAKTGLPDNGKPSALPWNDGLCSESTEGCQEGLQIGR